jgi:SMC interacting uncharacterized protein involved in chromosome segregation
MKCAVRGCKTNNFGPHGFSCRCCFNANGRKSKNKKVCRSCFIKAFEDVYVACRKIDDEQLEPPCPVSTCEQSWTKDFLDEFGNKFTQQYVDAAKKNAQQKLKKLEKLPGKVEEKREEIRRYEKRLEEAERRAKKAQEDKAKAARRKAVAEEKLEELLEQLNKCLRFDDD